MLRVMAADPARLDIGVGSTAAVLPGHYAAEEHIARIFARLGKPQAAAFIEGKLPTTKEIRSGDLGEILATEFIDAHTGYRAPIKRLRWKDHRNMAMRGDDVIGISLTPETGSLRFLKTEAKSRVSLSAGVVAEARAGLDKDGGLPTAHAVSFISECLLQLGNNALADAIDDAQYKTGITALNVQHLIFTFSGNAPDAHLMASLQAYTGPIAQWSLGLRVDGHAQFVKDVYERVIANANDN